MRRPFLRPIQESAASRMNASDQPLFEPIPGLEDMALDTLALNAFVPARRFEHSKRFYKDIGFTMDWSSDELAQFRRGPTSFMLQNFYAKDLAENLVMHLLVQSVDAWWAHLVNAGIGEKYQVRLVPPHQQPWRMRDFVLTDPSGVLWRIAQKTR